MKQNLTSPAWLAQIMVLVLAAFGIAFHDLPGWLQAVLVCGAVAGGIVYQVQHHRTVRATTAAAVEVQTQRTREAEAHAATAQAATATALVNAQLPAAELGVQRAS